MSADWADEGSSSPPGEIPNFADAAGGIAMDGGGIDRDAVALDARRIKFERGDVVPAGRHRAIAERERRKMARANQPPVFDAALRQIRLLVRAGALKGVDGVAAPRQHQRMVFEHDAKKAAVRQIFAGGDDDKTRLARGACCIHAYYVSYL